MSPPRPSRLRHRWLPGAVLLGVALLVWLVLPWPEHDAASSVPPSSPRASTPTSVLPPPPASGKTSAARPPPVLTAAAPAPPREEAPPGTTPARPPAAPPIELPPTTQALSEEFYPGTTEWEDVPVDESHAHRLRILPPRYNVVAPRPLAVWLEMVDAQGQRQPLSSPQVRMRLLDGATRPWLDVPVRDDGQGEDEAAGDRRYTASLQPTQEQKKALLGHVLVEARVDVPGGGTRMIPAVLLYTEGPRARLTGHWSDSVREGHLVLEAGLQVDEPGRFTLMAQVFGPHLEPLAWVKQTQTLEAGRRAMTLEVFGKLLRDQGIDGPYRVRQVLLT
ncbi:MAG: choice-of-anchor X domain-containing protein, partial [Cystobacter sp.]